ncbi:acyl-coenzyme A thioesterase 9, mitochondrial-like [Asterias rubens]|uniref:acyl-coenzyme A thioesterase 9, mitochondrial-like n=1 Tax=Asterias rubens TaxID=7604 RepID=UPI001455C803|nr:acyl-coenzyme A thioesterase 9, mitochondrial-like [Asterias rubens]
MTSPLLAWKRTFAILQRCSPQCSIGGNSCSARCFSETQSVPTIRQVRKQLQVLVGTQKVWSNQQQDRSALFKQLANKQDDLTVKCMKDSYQEAVIPLADDPRIQEKYLNFYNTVRIGKILEDLDTFAVSTSYLHNRESQGQSSPLVIVTALVDRINFHELDIKYDKDIKMCGNVTWAGKSSMEVTMNLHQKQDDINWKKLLGARFLMVARDPNNRGATFVHPLRAETPEEATILERGEKNKQLRLHRSEQSLFKSAPTAEEREIIHRLFVDTLDTKSASFSTRTKPTNSVWMEDSKLKNLLICFPEQRNLYNKIFGGFLMRQALELAYANAAVYCQTRPIFKSVDNIQFRKPVEVGDLLYLSSQVAFTDGHYMQLRVHAEVVDPTTGARDTTNVFHFTVKSSSQGPIPMVRPKTYGESMLFLNGRRHFLEFLEENPEEATT